MRFSGKSAIVTGAASGIGRAVATGLAAEGARVVVADINAAGAQEVARAIEQAGGVALAQPTDVTKAAEVERMVQAAVERFGGLDIMVNNAGILRVGLVVDTSEAEWELVLRTNLTSVFLGSKAAARQMIRQGRGGRIVNTSSIHAVLSEPNAGAYTAAKGGVEAFSRTLASELAPHKITVNCVRPGATWTNLSRPFYTPPVLAALNQRVPLQEVAQPEWIAAGVLFFASDEARYCTGTTLAIDGGYIMHGGLPGLMYE